MSLVAALALAACGSSDSGSDDNVVDLATVFSGTGIYAPYETVAQQAVEMAVEESNAAGGFDVNGETYTFKLHRYDPASKPESVPGLLQSAFSDGISLFFGPTLQSELIPAAQTLARSRDGLLFSAASWAGDFTADGLPIIGTAVGDKAVAPAYVKTLIAEFPDVKTVAVLMPNDVSGQRMRDAFVPEFKAAGIDVVAVQDFAPDTNDYAPIVRSLPRDVDAVFTGYLDQMASGVAQALVEADMTTTMFVRGPACQVGMDMPQLDAYTCSLHNEMPTIPSTDEAKAYFDKYAEKFNAEVDNNSQNLLLYYDYVGALVQAMQAAGTVTDYDKILAEFRGLTYDGVREIEFNEDLINISSLKVGIVRKGEVSVVDAEQ